jgi:hypothetical protein
LEKNEGAIKNGQSRYTDNIRNKRENEDKQSKNKQTKHSTGNQKDVL